MYSIIGLGKCGCQIAKNFEYFPQYSVYYIDAAQRCAENFFEMPAQTHPEKYEENCPDLSSFLENVEKDVCLIIGGSGYISAASLKILEGIRNHNITVLYIRPDVELLTDIRLMQDKVTFNVLQEYARSGVFQNIILVHNNSAANIAGNVSIKKYHEVINQLISSTFNMVNVFSNSDAVVSTFSDILETSRISTLGILNLTTGEEKLFYPIENLQEKKFFYAIPEEELEANNNLLKDITDQVKSTPKDIKAGFGIFATNYDENYCYTLNYSSKIQK
jgi:hypothetical protein